MYRNSLLPVQTIPVVAHTFIVKDCIPEDENIACAVLRICLKHSGGSLRMLAEQLFQWLNEEIQDVMPDATNWQKFVTIV